MCKLKHVRCLWQLKQHFSRPLWFDFWTMSGMWGKNQIASVFFVPGTVNFISQRHLGESFHHENYGPPITITFSSLSKQYTVYSHKRQYISFSESRSAYVTFNIFFNMIGKATIVCSFFNLFNINNLPRFRGVCGPN
jgi:hypothetical protein